MIQLDGSTELQAILDGVFKPPQREERRRRRRYSRRGLMHHPVLTLDYPGADGRGHAADPAAPADRVEAEAGNMLRRIPVATSEDLLQAGYAEGRVINPPPPTPDKNAQDEPDTARIAEGYLSGTDRFWSEGV